MIKQDIWISDLSHTAAGISAATFPLGASFVFSYAKQELGNDFNFRLFKFPKHLSEALKEQTPKMICFSNYSWNFELGYKFASIVKQASPNTITVFGGPNFPTVPEEMIELLQKKPNIDFYIELEGEMGFVALIKKLAEYNFNVTKLKENGEKLLNSSYLYDGKLIHGPKERIKDINNIPSPYLTGVLDDFFDLPLVPMIETTRGCPFSCTFCSDGSFIKSRVFRYTPERTKEELHYIAKRVKRCAELIITDLNFAMYKQDLITAKNVAEIQKIYGYPDIVAASGGKNLPKRTIEATKIMKGWTMDGAVQSTDPEVLKSIKRENLSTDAYKEMMESGNSKEDNKTHCEIILGLPGDTKKKHFESIRFGIDNKVNTIRMYQAMLLAGTEMSSVEDRKKFGFQTKFRTIPGCIGIYDILGKKHSVVEIEEIIVGNSTLSRDDYIECRIMNLIVESFYNNAMFEEVFAMLRAIGVSVMDCFIYIKEHSEIYSERIKEIIKSFVFETAEDLFDTWEDANKYVLKPEIVEKYIGGQLGTNELLLNRLLLFNEFDEMCNLMFTSVMETLRQKALLTKAIKDYLLDLKRFTIMRKKDALINYETVSNATFKHDFEAIQKAEYRIDPNSFPALEKPLKYQFFHDEKQQKYISDQVKLYSAHAIGLAKLFQRADLRPMFRRFTMSQITAE